jgi:outer membrane protein assembly factor BamB
MTKGNILLKMFLVFSGWILLGDMGEAANWARFRGPNGTGIASDKDIPVKWSEKSGILWKVSLPGTGHSSPIIWGDRLFIQSASAKERLLLCLDVKDGMILWKRSMPGNTPNKHKKNSYSSSTPATDGKLVYAVFWNGDKIAMYAYDFKGELAWKRDLDGRFRGRHGVGASPIVYQDKVFLNNDQTGEAVVIALDAKNGKPAWQKKRTAFRSCYSTPMVLNGSDGKAELIVVSTAGITSYNPANGDENWWWTWAFTGMPLRTVGSPVYSQGMIFSGSGDGSGARHMVAVKVGGKGDMTKKNLVWEKKRDFPYVPSMLIWKDHLYYVNDLGVAGCYVAKTGEQVWTKRLQGKVTASPVLIDGKIYAVTEDGDTYVFPAATSFKQLGKSSLGERVLASPAVADNRLFIRGESHLFCIGKAAPK